VWNCPEERDPCTDEHGHPRNDQSLNKPSLKKPLNGYAAIHINVLNPTGGELLNDIGWEPPTSAPRQPQVARRRVAEC
jgi:hypothetical protein